MTTRPAPTSPSATDSPDWSAVLADLSDAVVERAAMYLAGAMDDAEREAAEASLGSSTVATAPFRAAVAALQDAALALGEGAGAVDGFRSMNVEGAADLPSPVVRNRVLESIASGEPGRPSSANSTTSAGHDDARGNVAGHSASSHVWHGWSSDDGPAGLFTLRRDETGWEETGVDGVQVRRLFVDRPNNRMTAMFRMAPGTDYPEHVHNGFEECYVLEGELHVGEEIVMHAGDYQRADGGSEHARQWTEGGCVLLVSTSMSDEWTDTSHS